MREEERTLLLTRKDAVKGMHVHLPTASRFNCPLCCRTWERLHIHSARLEYTRLRCETWPFNDTWRVNLFSTLGNSYDASTTGCQSLFSSHGPQCLQSLDQGWCKDFHSFEKSHWLPPHSSHLSIHLSTLTEQITCCSGYYCRLVVTLHQQSPEEVKEAALRLVLTGSSKKGQKSVSKKCLLIQLLLRSINQVELHPLSNI